MTRQELQSIVDNIYAQDNPKNAIAEYVKVKDLLSSLSTSGGNVDAIASVADDLWVDFSVWYAKKFNEEISLP